METRDVIKESLHKLADETVQRLAAVEKELAALAQDVELLQRLGWGDNVPKRWIDVFATVVKLDGHDPQTRVPEAEAASTLLKPPKGNGTGPSKSELIETILKSEPEKIWTNDEIKTALVMAGYPTGTPNTPDAVGIWAHQASVSKKHRVVKVSPGKYRYDA